MKKIMKLAAIMLLTVTAGCANTHDLEEKWVPLEQIVERPGNDSWMTTIGKSVYIANLESWLTRNPPTSVLFGIKMAHEHVHSIRQHEAGVTKFLAIYLSNRSYRWREEQLGWYVQMKLLRRHGYRVNAEGVIRSLSKYSPKLAEPDEIRKWVTDVMRGNWKPAEGDLPEQYKDL